jgi:hypothetical protein
LGLKGSKSSREKTASLEIFKLLASSNIWDNTKEDQHVELKGQINAFKILFGKSEAL